MVEYGIEFAKVFFLFNVVMGFGGILTWVERKQSALMQDRIGANRAEIFGFRILGLFHIIADAVKMLLKEDFIPPQGNRLLHTLAPMLALFFALMAFAVVPFGGVYQFGGYTVSLQLLDLNVGLLFVFAMMSMGIYGFVLAGWSSANNFALLGGLRASGQMISYEITMGATVIGAILVYGTLDLQQMVVAQGTLMGGWIPLWGVLLQPVGCVLFMTAALAETKRVPFDVPEGESEIIGYFVEYSGMKFGMFFLTDFLETIVVASLATTLFFGGWQVPYLMPDGFHFPWGGELLVANWIYALLGFASFSIKGLIFMFVFMQLRWTLPRFRYDQLMSLGWKGLFPIAVANVVVTAIVLVLFGGGS